MKPQYVKSNKRPFLNSLKKHRTQMHYKQRHVAMLLNLHNTSQICRWEKGLSMPNAMNLFKLSIIYRTFPNELYFALVVKLRHDVLSMEENFFQDK
jgi:transcriptional regulator with XRE-family HTH domain